MMVNVLRRRRKALDSARARASKWSALRPLGWVAAAGFGWLAYGYLTLPDVRSLATVNPTTTAFMELRRAKQLASRGKTPRAVQRWVPYTRIAQN